MFIVPAPVQVVPPDTPYDVPVSVPPFTASAPDSVTFPPMVIVPAVTLSAVQFSVLLNVVFPVA